MHLRRRMYAFDVHCNSYFPLFLLLYGAHFDTPFQLLNVTWLGALHKFNTVEHWKQGEPDMGGFFSWRAVVQFLLSPLLLWRSFLATLLSNTLYAFALCYYHYLSFLGYSALPFLEHTEVFLWPVAAILVIVPFAVLAGFNPTRFTLNIYFG